MNEININRDSQVTLIDNDTGKETRGIIKEYTPNRIVLQSLPSFKVFDAQKVHFKE